MTWNRIKLEILYPLLVLVIAGTIFGYISHFWPGRAPSGGPVITAVPQAPQLWLVDLSGTPFNTSSFKGKVVLVNFWAAWCTPCAQEVPHFVELQQRYQDQGLQIIGISIDDSDSELRDFYRKFKMNYPVIAGNQKLAQAYGGILGLPTTLVIGRHGFVQGKYVGSTDFGVLEQEVVALLRPQNDKSPH
ncbi:MAG TPA: TlpA disulfide reductase family protein [Candidatus Angelobacter sp.]|nr:TlpA disulfide reductase family protein [Candidatus Angelobacter sp.]